MPTVQDIKDRLGIDWTDDATDRRLAHLNQVATAYLQSSLGIGHPTNDARVKELALIIIGDLYDQDAQNDKVSANIQRLIDDFSLQIKLEMRGHKL